MGLPADGDQVIAEIARIAVLPGSLAERAEALLEPLRRVTPFDAAFLALFEPECRRQVPLVRTGYPATVGRYMDGRNYVDEVEYLGLDRSRPPMRVKDLPIPPQDLLMWSQHLQPAGLLEGIGTGLFTSDGRYLGIVTLNVADPRPASDAARDLLAACAPLIAHAVDPLRTIRALADVVATAVAGVLTTRAGNIMALPGLPGDRLLTAGSAVLSTAETLLAQGPALVRFLAPCDHAADAAVVQVTALVCPPQPPGHLCTVVLLSPPPDLHGLTHPELRILGLLIRGRPHDRIAATLNVAQPAVAGHVAQIMVKLDAGSAVVAAVRALRHGLYLPAALGVAASEGE